MPCSEKPVLIAEMIKYICECAVHLAFWGCVLVTGISRSQQRSCADLQVDRYLDATLIVSYIKLFDIIHYPGSDLIFVVTCLFIFLQCVCIMK